MLLDAVTQGNKAAVAHALAEGADANAVDRLGRTPLATAVRLGHESIVQALLDVGANANTLSSDGLSPLTRAARLGRVRIVDMLLRAGTVVGLDREKSMTLDSHTTSANGTRSPNQSTALIGACEGGHTEIVEMLIEAGANVNAVNTRGNTALLAASDRGTFATAARLLAKRADPNHANLWGDTPLIRASREGHLSVVNLLLTAGADVRSVNRDGYSALLAAIDCTRVAVVDRLLDEERVELNLVGSNGESELLLAAMYGMATVVPRLLVKGAHIHHANHDGQRALGIASAAGHVDVVEQLIAAGAEIDYAYNQGSSALRLAVSAGHREVVKVLLAAGAIADMASVMHGACDAELVEIWVASGADVNGVNAAGVSALEWAAQSGNADVVDVLLKSGARVCGSQARSALVNASRVGCATSVKKLLDAGSDVNFQTDEGLTALIVAIQDHTRAQSWNIVEALLSAHSDVDLAAPRGVSALHAAVTRNDAYILDKLLEMGANPNVADEGGRTPFMVSATRAHLVMGSYDTMKKLLRAGANVDATDDEGRTALLLAAAEGERAVVDLLLESGANVEAAVAVALDRGDTAAVNFLQR